MSIIQKAEQKLYIDGVEKNSFKNRDGEEVSFLELYCKPIGADGQKSFKQQKFTASADLEDQLKPLVGKTAVLEVELKIEAARVRGVIA